MKAQPIIAAVLAVLLIACVTGAILGRISWWVFWIFAFALFLYTRFLKRVNAN